MSQWKKRLTAIAVAAAVILAVPTAVFAVKSILEPDPPVPSQVVTVSAAQITAEAPEAGKAPSAITADGDDYVISSYEWLEGDKEVSGAFEEGKQYSLKVTLKANDYAKFTAFKPSVSGAQSVTNGTVSGQNPGNSLIFTATFPKTEEGTAPVVQKKSYLSYQNGEINLVAKFSDAENIIYNLGPKGPNSLFEFKKFSLVGAGTHGQDAIEDGGWLLMANGTDFLGPYTVNVASAPFKHSPFTGGNHGYKDSGSTTDPENTPTGRMVSFQVFADGVAVEDGYSGYAQTITFKWVNMVQAANTVQPDGSGREVLKEEYEMVFDGEKCNIHNVITVLEKSYITSYYGLQIVTPWATDGIKYLDAANTQWNSYIGRHNCGDKTCSSVLFKRGRYYCKMSIDPTVGIGSREYLYGDNQYAVFQEDYGGGNGKTYFHLFRDVPDPFEAGTVLEFKGAYHFFYE